MSTDTLNLAVAPQQGQPANNQPAPSQQPQQQVVPNAAQLPIIPPSFTSQPQGTQSKQQPQPQQQEQAYTRDAVVNALASHLNVTPDVVRNELGNRDPLEFVGAIARESIGYMRQSEKQQLQQQQVTPQVQPQQQQGQQFRPDASIPLPDGWESVVQRGQDGVYQPISPVYKQYADIANHNAIVEQKRMSRIMSDPTQLVKDPTVQQVIDKMVKEQVSAQTRQFELKSLREKYRSEYAKDIVQHDAEGKPMHGLDGKPMLTPFGQAFARISNEFAEAGMPESERFYQAAYHAAAAEAMPPSRIAQQQQQQRTNPVDQWFGNQQPQQQVQTSGFQKILNNSQTWFPGAPPSRESEQPLTLQGAAFAALADVPDGRSAGEYFQHIGKLFS